MFCNHLNGKYQVIYFISIHRSAITPQNAVGDRRVGPVIMHPAAMIICRIPTEDAVGHRRVGLGIIHPAASLCLVIAYLPILKQ